MLRIAIQAKGRLNEESIGLLAEAGVSIEDSKRKLLARSDGFPLEVLYLRDDDIPQAVSMGVADLGVVGLNEVEEKGFDVEIVHRLGFGKCRLSLAVPKTEPYDGLSYFEGKRVATSYPVILSRFFREKGIAAEIHEIAGSVEIAPSVGMADAIFDIVSSGGTLVTNGLKEVEQVLFSEAVLIGGRALSDDKRQILSQLLFRIEAVERSRGLKYVLMNLPHAKIPEAVRILPGMKSPTILPLAQEGWSSMHVVINERELWSKIEQLKAIGAEDILVRITVNPPKSEWADLLRRPQIDAPVIGERVAAILERVRAGGDRAVLDLTAEIDSVALDSLEVAPEEIERAEAAVSPELKRAIATAAEHIERFHAAQRPRTVDLETAPGVRCLQRAVPIRRVGLYVPGGSAPLFSTVLMLAVPARVAGCEQIVLCTPPQKDGSVAPAVLYAASVAGVRHIFKAGGAQAIGAMAYGTQSIPRVDKIFGPGNQYVTAAKQQVASSSVAIDMPAGPSEVLVMADSTAVPAFVAADLLSQAEHGPDSQTVLLTPSRGLAEQVAREVERQLAALPRRQTAALAIENSRIVVLDSPDEMIEMSNAYAPEHLILSVEDPWAVAERITAAGSVFLGNYTPESAGDYASGTNHTLPTYGWARSMSGVNLDSFLRKITYQQITPDGLRGLGPTIETMASAEGLDAHRNAVTIRLESL